MLWLWVSDNGPVKEGNTARHDLLASGYGLLLSLDTDWSRKWEWRGVERKEKRLRIGRGGAVRGCGGL